MSDNRSSPAFSLFIYTVVWAHLSQLVWNFPQPLLPEDSPVSHISPFDHSEDSSLETLSGAPSSDESVYFEPSNNGRNKETRDIHGRGPEMGPICSIFQTFLDSRNVNCRHSPRPFTPEDSPERLIFNPRNNRHEDLLESNNIVPQHGDLHARIPLHEQIEDQADSRIDNLNGPPPEIPLDENGNADETKIIRSKTMIVVPERGCPPGKRKDIRGYCRTVYRFQPYTNPPPRPGPIRFYYRRFVAVPTLHFILR